MSSHTYDVAIIGGGIVGLSCAYQLTARGCHNLIVLEAEDRIAPHQSSHNSGVIHSGLYYRPGSLKARLCAEGREAMIRFCQENGVAHERCGKIVVAVDASELPALDELERRGRANGLQGLRRISAEDIRDHEPHVRGVAGLHVPETGIADYAGVAAAYAARVRAAGSEVRLNAKFQASRPVGDQLVLTTSQGDVLARHLINCGGLRSDQVARRCGVQPGVMIVPFRGEYYELAPERRHLVRNLVYPVPDPRFPFLGVHFTRTVHGMVEAGPNAVLALRREGYSWWNISPVDLAQTFTYPGFWRMAGKYWKTGFGEMYRSLNKGAFLRALQKLMPDLRAEDIRPAGAGVRAQALDPSGALVDDFRIVECERMIHVLNAPSPAATASISIGQTIVDKAVKNFGLATVRDTAEKTP